MKRVFFMYGIVKIAIIDDGVYDDFFNTRMEEKIEITHTLNLMNQKDLPPQNPNHGSICAGIIKKYAPNASIVSIKILNNDGRGECKQLLKSIQWCMDNGIKVINLSLGTVHYEDRHELRKIVNKAVKKGMIIVSACSNEGIITYPSYLSNIIGVKADNEGYLNEGEYIYNIYPNDGIEITAVSIHKLSLKDGTDYYTQLCNSYATPFITAKVYSIVSGEPGICVENVKGVLMREALNRLQINRYYLYKDIDWVQNGLVVQLNNNKLQSFNENPVFKVKDIIPVKCDCFCETTRLIREYFHSHKNLISKIDTVVVVGDIAIKHYNSKVSDFIKSIIEMGKNVVYIDDREIHSTICIDNAGPKSKIWHPSIFNYLNTSILRKVEIPVIIIYDFTGRYYIKIIRGFEKKFIKNGYNPLSVSDSCYGILYGINYGPLINHSLLKDHDPGGLKSLCGLFDPELLFYGVDATDKANCYYDYMNKCFDIDLNIFVIDEFDKRLDDCIEISKNSGGKFLILLPSRFKEILKVYKDSRVFHMCNTYINNIYKYILDLYK